MRKRHSIVIGQRRGIILLPDESMYIVMYEPLPGRVSWQLTSV